MRSRDVSGSPIPDTPVDLTFILLSLLLLGLPTFASVFSAEILGGWDGVSHVAMAEDYARHTWPSLRGWTPHWYLGMPFPDFYHPLFFWLAGLLHHVTPFSISALVKGFVLLLTFLLPVLTYLVTRKYCGGRYAAVCAGFLCVFLMTRSSNIADNGLTLLGSFKTGLYAHLLAFDLVLTWLLVFPDFRSGPRPFWGSVALLSLIFLANVNVLANVLLLFLGFLFADLRDTPRSVPIRARLLLDYFRVGFLASIPALVWYIPLLRSYRWVVTRPLEPPGPLALPYYEGQFFLLFAIGAYLAWKQRNRFGTALAISTLAMLVAAPAAKSPLLSSLPIQPHRNLVNMLFLAIPVLTFFMSEVVAAVQAPWLKLAVVLVLPSAFYFQDLEHFIQAEPIDGFDRREFDGFRPQMFDPAQGRFLVEAAEIPFADRRDEAWYLNGLLGNRGGYGLLTVYREASIASFFADPVRNYFSLNPYPVWGVTARLATDREFLGQTIDAQLRRNRLLNLKYIFTRSEPLTRFMRSLPDFRETARADGWHLFEDRADLSLYAHIPPNLPFLAYSEWAPKRRDPYGDYDFISLAEHLFLRNRDDLPIARARDPHLDRGGDWERFGGLLITSFRYGDRNRARDRILAFARTKPVVALDEADEALVAELKRHAGSHLIRFVPPYRSDDDLGDLVGRIRERELTRVEGKPDPILKKLRLELDRRETAIKTRYRETADRIVDLIDTHKTPVRSKARIVRTVLGRESTEVILDRPPEEPLPVVVHQTYFPSWKQANSEEDGYLTSPCYTLIYGRSDRLALQLR